MSGGNYEAAFKKYRDLRYQRVNRELRNKLLREWREEGSLDLSWLYGEQAELRMSTTCRCRRPGCWRLRPINDAERVFGSKYSEAAAIRTHEGLENSAHMHGVLRPCPSCNA